MNTLLFSEIFGHNKVKDVLISAANSDRVGHAYILEGPKGVGKLTLAKAFAMRLLCESPRSDDACGACRSCSQCMSKNHPDLTVVTNQLYDSAKKSTDILVDTVRNMKKDIYIKPYMSSRKVYIVPNADTMNIHAQNSLLKVLEEPPEYCSIILLAENSNSFLPTILSRAPILKLFPLSEEETRAGLERLRDKYDAERLELAAKMCGGCIGSALALLENTETDTLRAELLDNIFALAGNRRKSIYDLSLFLKQNKDDFELLKNIMQGLFADILYVKSTGSTDKLTNCDKAAKIQKLSDTIGDKCPIYLNEILFKYSDYFARNISFGLMAQCLSIKLWEAINDRGYRSKI